MLGFSRACRSPLAGRYLRLAAINNSCQALSTSSGNHTPSWLFSSQAEEAEGPVVGRLNHVAIAVPDLAVAAQRFRDVLGAAVSDPQALPAHGVTVVFVTLPNAKLELLEPLGESSPVAGFLAKNPAGGIHHICLETPAIDAAVARARGAAVRTLGDIRNGAHGLPVAFLHPKDMCGVLTELEEARPPAAAGGG